jgi:predicted dehydrogenase
MAGPSSCTVLGSGFGLYGYLPAAIELGWQVRMPARYREKMAKRAELSRYLPRVIWCADEAEALRRSDSVIVALRPDDQATWIPRLAQMDNLRWLILEKPIASDPDLAASMLSMLMEARKIYRVGYTFRFTPWARELADVLKSQIDGVFISWTFKAHHYRFNLENWKRSDPAGGGALRFYGIHLIALLAELGYSDVLTSKGFGFSKSETERWEATLTGPGVPPLALRVDANSSETGFRIVTRTQGLEQTLVDQTEPFARTLEAAIPGQDPRVTLLMSLCRSLCEVDQDHAARQVRIIELWRTAESLMAGSQ